MFIEKELYITRQLVVLTYCLSVFCHLYITVSLLYIERWMFLCHRRLELMALCMQSCMFTKPVFHLWRTAEKSTTQLSSLPTSLPLTPRGRETRRRWNVIQYLSGPTDHISATVAADLDMWPNELFLWLHQRLSPRSENPVSHWRPHLSITMMSEDFTFNKAGLPSDVRRYMRV